MRIITASLNTYIVEITNAEFSKLTGLDPLSFFYTSDLRVIEGKKFDLEKQLDRMRELQICFETQDKILTALDKCKLAVSNAMWPCEEIKKKGE